MADECHGYGTKVGTGFQSGPTKTKKVIGSHRQQKNDALSFDGKGEGRVDGFW
jgi:hypothetical protein